MNPEQDSRPSVPEQDNVNTDHGEAIPVSYRPQAQTRPFSQSAAPVTPASGTLQVPALAAEQKTTPATIILQWLSYAFWGWLILAVMYLIGITTAFALMDNTYVTPEPVAYGVAAALILLAIAFVCDQLYSKREPEHKHGAGMVILVIHAVIFALFGIGALIAVAFSGINIAITTGDHTNPTVIAATAGAGVVLYLITLLRTVRPLIFRSYRLIFRLLMTALVLAVATWGIIGPVAEAARTKDDQAVRGAIETVDSEIRSYIMSKESLPTDLSQIQGQYDDQTIKDLVGRGLISYAIQQPPANPLDSDTADGFKTFYYELCATYKYDQKRINGYYGYSYSSSPDANGYSENYSLADAHAGKNCQKLKTSTYLSDPTIDATDVTTIEPLRS